MGTQKAETANKNMRRRIVCIKKYGPSGRNNRRSLCEKKPKGCRFGDRYDRGIASNTLCLEAKKFAYNGSSW